MGRREKVVVGLDVGSAKVGALIGVIRDSGIELAGFSSTESRGVKRGVVVNLDAAADSIRRSVGEAEAMAKVEADQVFVGIAGPHVKSFNSKGVIPLATRSREIGSDDVRRVIETARVVALAPDREIVHILPQEFTVDDEPGIVDPIGMVGARLEVNVHIVTSSTTAAQNIVTAVNRAGLLVGDTVLEPIAAGEAVLTDDERELGTVLVDIGAGKTSVAIYHRGAVRHSAVVPIGGELFTNDIAVGLRTTIPEAERLKREHGCALSSMASADAVFEVAGIGSRPARSIAQQVLSDILQPRAEEIVHFVRTEIRNAGYDRQAGAGLVLTGGGAKLKGLAQLAEEILDLPIRIGSSFPAFETAGIRASNFFSAEGPEFATLSGLVLLGERRRRSQDFHENPGSGLKKLVAKLRTLM